MRSHPGGTLIISVGHLPGSDATEVVSATLRVVFPVVAATL